MIEFENNFDFRMLVNWRYCNYWSEVLFYEIFCRDIIYKSIKLR